MSDVTDSVAAKITSDMLTSAREQLSIFKDLQKQTKDNASAAAASESAAAVKLAAVVARKAEIEAAIAAHIPGHQWSGTSLRLTNPDGSLGNAVNLIGPQGVQGATGATGPRGFNGDKGETGPQGIQGPQGANGATGPQGANGTNGTTGLQGIQGPQGDAGQDADVVLPTKPFALSGVDFLYGQKSGGAIRVPMPFISIGAYNAKGNGIVDDRPALVAANDEGSPIILGPGTYRLATNYLPTSPIVSFGGAIEVDGVPLWYPTTLWDFSAPHLYGKRTVHSGTYSGTPTTYVSVEESFQVKLEWFNTEGYQQPDGSGHYASDSGGRTGMTQMRLLGQHSGFGDGYNIVYNMTVHGHSAKELITGWSGAASGGFAGGTTYAVGDKCSLYGIGDIILDDLGHENVAMLGHVLILHANGEHNAAYGIPRLAYYADNRGTEEINALVSGHGLFRNGIDLSFATISGNAIALKAGQKIGFESSGSAGSNGTFYSPTAGNTYISGNGTDLNFVVKNNGIFSLSERQVFIDRNQDNSDILRIYGSNSTDFLQMGQFASTAIIGGASTGTNSVDLMLRVAIAGVETEAMRLTTTGHVKLTATPTYADNAAAVAGGLAAKELYITSTGEVRARV